MITWTISISHGRDMSHLMEKELEQKSCLVKPAPLKKVLRDVKEHSNRFKDNDFVLVIGGKNDIGSGKESDLVDEYLDVETSLPDNKCLIPPIPPRYDLSPYSIENRSIGEINKTINELGSIFINIKVLDYESKSFQLFAKGVFTSTLRGRLPSVERLGR
ncbi:hypothetical protein J6590_009977 [Homalodisca vitripennis]|nr:hypothetical protein J6590_009977 [Homalodisca vitripennis]